MVTDADSSGTVTVGDLIRPTIAAVQNERFYVIDTSGDTYTLLAEKNPKHFSKTYTFLFNYVIKYVQTR